ncbi:RXRBA protein, partial [Atractosteus spatula]|nr:RXRBA protein [Atractosteus spatula]
MTPLPPMTTAVNSPISSLGSPFSVISSSLGSPCVPGTPSVGYGPISSPQCMNPSLSLCQINSTVSMSGLHTVTSSDDVKPPFGLKPMSAHSPGPMMSQKRLCAICGDRSSGERGPVRVSSPSPVSPLSPVLSAQLSPVQSSPVQGALLV